MSARKAKTRRRSGRDPLARERALETLSRMRGDGLSLTRAARESGTTATTVRKYARSALRRSRNGRYTVTPSDRLTRRVLLLTEDGNIEVRVRSSRAASRIAQHMAAVERYLRTGNVDLLETFQGESFRAGDETHEFIADTAALDRLALANEVSFERLYVLRA